MVNFTLEAICLNCLAKIVTIIIWSPLNRCRFMFIDHKLWDIVSHLLSTIQEFKDLIHLLELDTARKTKGTLRCDNSLLKILKLTQVEILKLTQVNR